METCGCRRASLTFFEGDRRMRPRLPWILLALLALLLFSAPAVAEQDPAEASLKFFQDLAETRDYSLGRPVAARFTPDGRSVLFLRGGARDPALRLYEMEVKTGAVREVLTPEALLRGAEEKLSVEERARREGAESLHAELAAQGQRKASHEQSGRRPGELPGEARQGRPCRP